MADIVRSVPPVSMFGFTLTANGLKAGAQVPFEDWEALGDWLRHCEGAVHWWIGDWLNYGEANYGHMYTQATDATGFAYQTVADDKWVAKEIEPSRRRESLPFSHHKEVARLDDRKAQDRLLDIAEQEKWNRETIREEVSKLKGNSLAAWTPLHELRDAWSRATPEEKKAFFLEIRDKVPD